MLFRSHLVSASTTLSFRAARLDSLVTGFLWDSGDTKTSYCKKDTKHAAQQQVPVRFRTPVHNGGTEVACLFSPLELYYIIYLFLSLAMTLKGYPLVRLTKAILDDSVALSNHFAEPVRISLPSYKLLNSKPHPNPILFMAIIF